MQEKIKECMNENQEEKNYINCPSSKILERIKKFSINPADKQVRFHEKIKSESSLNVWKLGPKLILMGQVWDSPTEFLTFKNSLEDVQNYIEKVSKNQRCLYYTSNKNIEVKNLLLIENLEFNLEIISKIANSIQAWQDLDDNNIVIIEIDYQNITFYSILIECIQIYLTKIMSLSISFLEIEALKGKLTDINTIDRYRKYFYNLTCKNTDKLEILTLHQVIISNYPILEDFNQFRVSFSVENSDGILISITDVDDIDIIYKDNFYIVLTNINLEINGDANLCLYFINDKTEKKIFEFPVNVFYYEQGLYRYKKDDIITNLKYKFFDEFKFDLVFLENNKTVTLNYLKKKNDIIQGIKIINQLARKKENEISLARFVNKGYNRIVGAFCDIMDYSEKDAADLINILEMKGYKNMISNTKPLKVSSITFKNDIVRPDIQSFIKEAFPQREVVDREALYKEIQNREFKVIELIKDEDIQPEIKKKVNKKIFFKKKESINETQEDLDFKSLRPLHWIPIVNNDDTIFKKLGFYESKLDLEKFKKHFCVKNTGFTEEIPLEIKHGSVVIDPKRLFLVSLALNHLNKKKITPENIYEILRTNSKEVYIQDLLNLENVFPTYEETYLLATCEYEKLAPEEKLMLEYSKLIEVKKIVKILLFERKFFDEIFLIEDLLEKVKFTFDKLVDSQDLKIVLKMLLDIGNLINYEFSIRKKKLKGFKLSSIFLFLDYKGHDDFSLFQFFMESIEYKSITTNLKKDFKYLDIIRKEQFSKLKDKINYYIEQFKDNLDLYYTLEHDKPNFKNFLLFVSDKLDNIKSKFQECALKANQIKKLFDEGEKKNILEVLDCIVFLINKMVSYKKT